MNRFTLTLLGLLFVAACSASSEDAPNPGAAKPASAGVVFYSGARIIPGDGTAPIEEATMIVTDGKITQIGKKGEIQPPKGAGRVELDGRTLMPVFVNLAARPGLNNGANFGPSNYKTDSVMADLNRYGYYGVYAVLSSGGDAGNTIFQIRDEQRAGKQTGALVYAAGRGITAKGGYPTSTLKDVPIQVSTEAEARKAVTENADNKADAIMMWVDDNMGRSPKLKPELYRAIIDEAHKHNLKAVAEVFSLADAKELVKSGIDGLLQSIRDREVDDEFISMMKEKNVFLAPALTGEEAKFVYAEKPKWLGEQTMREVYPAQLSAYLANDIVVNRFKRNSDLGNWKEQYTTAAKNLKKLSEGGVKIALGTNSGSADTYPGYFEHRELELMTAAGMAPMDVIKAATSVPAGFLGLDIGVIAAGKEATFFVLSANPLDDMKNSKEIVTIYKNGSEMDRLKMIQNITIDVPKITERDKQEDAEAQRRAALELAESKLPHYGRFVLGSSALVRGFPIPTPKGAKAAVQKGPPDKITVTMSASSADLRQFYSDALAKYGWKSAGGCWEKQNPINSKPNTLCVESSSNAAVIQITEK